MMLFVNLILRMMLFVVFDNLMLNLGSKKPDMTGLWSDLSPDRVTLPTTVMHYSGTSIIDEQ